MNDMGYTYTKTLFFISNSNLTGYPVLLFAKSSNPTPGMVKPRPAGSPEGGRGPRTRSGDQARSHILASDLLH